MNATDRFKALLVNTLERVCILEEQLELAQARITELETELETEGRADDQDPGLTSGQQTA